MPILMIPIGIAGSGKTTYFIENNKYCLDMDEFVHVSADAIRFKKLDSFHSGIYFDSTIEHEVWQEVWALLIKHISQRKEIYLDCTNLTKAIRAPYIYFARCYGYKIKIILFNSPLKEDLARNAERGRVVPEKVIARQYCQLEIPEKHEYDYLEEKSVF